MSLSVACLFSFCFAAFDARPQCPPNIDFEAGSFANWTCYVGNTSAAGGTNQINLAPTGPVSGRHTMYAANSGIKDVYGDFPVNCPNGSGYSVRLGNDAGGGEAEGIAYDLTIPAGQNEYSLIYHYAVVFQDPVHEIFQQPRMVVEITNVSDNTLISCSSFTFIPFGSILPGFFESSTRGSDGTPIWCKDWSAVSVNLDNLAGKTVRLLFKTADCTFRRHFGYAYIDVNSECSSEFVGATFCNDDTAVTVTAPYGYQSYRWFNQSFTQVLGANQSIRFDPPPAVGTTVAVEVVPYNGYGCIDTLYARLVDTLTLRAIAGPDKLFCGRDAVQLGAIPKPGVVYSWGPVQGLNDAALANPMASPAVKTSYVLSVRNFGGGCRSQDTVVVESGLVDNAVDVIGKLTYCFGSGDSTVFQLRPVDKAQWFRNGSPITGATGLRYRATQSGTYTAQLTSLIGCVLDTDPKTVFIDVARPGIRYSDEYAVISQAYPLDARPFGAQYLWQPSTYLSNAALPRTYVTSPTDREYTVRIETASGCVTVDSLAVKVVPSADIYVPTAFTPNNDGLNDLLRPVLMGIKELKYFRVFNRWGQLLHEARVASTGWDGRLGGQPQPTGAVVWVAEGLGGDGKPVVRKGTCVLIR